MNDKSSIEQKYPTELIRDIWHGKPYYSLDAYCKNTYGEKLYKVSIDAGFSCPNRDGTLDTRGCIFCSSGGSGEFASPLKPGADLAAAFQQAYADGISFVSGKSAARRYIVYFQAYTNTYGPVSYLEQIYRLALEEPSCAGISIATRPDALPDEVIALLSKLKKEYAPKFVWIELGLQTIHERTALFIRRGYPLSCFEESVEKLHQAEIPMITHIILGLPGESDDEMLENITYLNHTPIAGIKLQLLHILKNTDLGRLYEKSPDDYCTIYELEQYLDILIACLTHLRPDIVVHRLTGDAKRSLLLAPAFSSDKRGILNSLHHKMRDTCVFQGKYWELSQNKIQMENF